MTATGCNVVSFRLLKIVVVPTYSDSDVLRGGKEPVDQHSHKRRVEAVLRFDLSKTSIRHTLRHDDCTNSDTGDQVSNKPLEVVSVNPSEKRKEVPEI